MVTKTFKQVVKSTEQLREIIGDPQDLVLRIQLTSLDRHCRTFIARSPFLLIGTSNGAGMCDVSPKGDAPGFVQVLDDNTLLIPDRPGNRRADTLSNIIDNSHVGLLFVIPGLGETLRVNGRATVIQDSDVLEPMAVNGRQPLLGIVVEVREAYLHCAKAFKRAHLWENEHWIPASEHPSLAKMVIDHAKLTDCTVEELEDDIQEAYKELY